jgi:nucleoside-diphosphate-sugar epimerase
MRVLVTGATGCLGGSLARRLATDGFAVTANGRNVRAGKALSDAGMRFEAADLGDATAIDGLVAGHDIVVHCGGFSSAWGPASAYRAANVDGTRHVVDAARRHDVRRLVFISTPSLYFDFTSRLNIAEDAPLAKRPVNHYAASKRAAELIVREAARGGLRAVIVRPRAIIGPGDAALLPRLLRVAAKGRLPLIDGGRAIIDLTYVENVVDALVAIATGPAAIDGKTYNVTNGEPATVASLLQRIVDALALRVRFVGVPFGLAYALASALEAAARARPGCPEPALTRYGVGVLGRSQTLSIDAARRDFGYRPRIALAEGIERTAAAWRAAHA